MQCWVRKLASRVSVQKAQSAVSEGRDTCRKGMADSASSRRGEMCVRGWLEESGMFKLVFKLVSRARYGLPSNSHTRRTVHAMTLVAPQQSGLVSSSSQLLNCSTSRFPANYVLLSLCSITVMPPRVYRSQSFDDVRRLPVRHRDGCTSMGLLPSWTNQSPNLVIARFLLAYTVDQQGHGT